MVGWTTYVPRRADDPAEPNPVVRIRHRLRAEPHPFPKVLVPGAPAGAPGAVLTQGSHGLVLDGRVVAPMPLDGVSLAHFPIRDVVQHAEKTATRWLQRAAVGGAGAEDLFYEVQLERRQGADWEAFAASVWGAVPSYLADDGALEHLDAPIDYRGGELRLAAPVRSLGPVLGRTLQLADRVIRSTRVAPDSPAHPTTVHGTVVDGPVDTVEIVVDAPGVLVDV